MTRLALDRMSREQLAALRTEALRLWDHRGIGVRVNGEWFGFVHSDHLMPVAFADHPFGSGIPPPRIGWIGSLGNQPGWEKRMWAWVHRGARTIVNPLRWGTTNARRWVNALLLLDAYGHTRRERAVMALHLAWDIRLAILERR